MEVKFRRCKVTPNYWVFKCDKSEENQSVIGTIYMKKSADIAERPQELTVTIEKGESDVQSPTA